jgi:hypothetical protein
MIENLDETIKNLLIKKGPMDPSEVDISFDTPNREWSASVSKPTINLYLYDIRENHHFRGTEWFVENNPNGTTTRKKNASRMDLSYLVTVWTNNIEDQHRLLWRVLATLFQYPVIPQELLSGPLAQQDYPVVTVSAQPDGLFNSPADFWAALDNEIKPSINYVVTLPLEAGIAFTAAAVRTKTVSVKPPDGPVERIAEVVGTVHSAGKSPRPVVEATILAKESGFTSITDAGGRYSFPKLPEGKHTFVIIVSGKKVKEVPVTIPGSNYDLEL